MRGKCVERVHVGGRDDEHLIIQQLSLTLKDREREREERKKKEGKKREKRREEERRNGEDINKISAQALVKHMQMRDRKRSLTTISITHPQPLSHPLAADYGQVHKA